MKKILCIGSITTDVIVCHVDSLPNPGVLQGVEQVTTHVGGCAANAAIDLGIIGIPSALSCKIGGDNFGEFVRSTAADHGVDTSGVVLDSSLSTTTSIVCVNSSGERSFLYNPGSTSAFVSADIPDSLVEKYDIIFVAGAMLLTSFDGQPCADFMAKCQKMGKFTVLDTAWDFEDIWGPKVLPSLPYLDLFMPSYEEAAKLSGKQDVKEIAEFFKSLGAKNIIIKMGSDGAYFAPEGQEPFSLPVYPGIKPADTTGAGDAFCAGFLAGMSLGWDFKQCGKLANASGAHCVMAVGASSGLKPLDYLVEFINKHEKESN